jgi:hypothetical protein
MLALLFNSELPGTGLGPSTVGRLRDVCLRVRQLLEQQKS